MELDSIASGLTGITVIGFVYWLVATAWFIQRRHMFPIDGRDWVLSVMFATGTELASIFRNLIPIIAVPCGWPTYLYLLAAFVCVNCGAAHTTRTWTLLEVANERMAVQALPKRKQLKSPLPLGTPMSWLARHVDWFRTKRLVGASMLLSLLETGAATALYGVALADPAYDRSEYGCAFSNRSWIFVYSCTTIVASLFVLAAYKLWAIDDGYKIKTELKSMAFSSLFWFAFFILSLFTSFAPPDYPVDVNAIILWAAHQYVVSFIIVYPLYLSYNKGDGTGVRKSRSGEIKRLRAGQNGRRSPHSVSVTESLGINLGQLMHDSTYEDLHTAFREYLISTFAVEGYLFYFAVCAYQEQCAASPAYPEFTQKELLENRSIYHHTELGQNVPLSGISKGGRSVASSPRSSPRSSPEAQGEVDKDSLTRPIPIETIATGPTTADSGIPSPPDTPRVEVSTDKLVPVEPGKATPEDVALAASAPEGSVSSNHTDNLRMSLGLDFMNEPGEGAHVELSVKSDDFFAAASFEEDAKTARKCESQTIMSMWHWDGSPADLPTLCRWALGIYCDFVMQGGLQRANFPSKETNAIAKELRASIGNFDRITKRYKKSKTLDFNTIDLKIVRAPDVFLFDALKRLAYDVLRGDPFIRFTMPSRKESEANMSSLSENEAEAV